VDYVLGTPAGGPPKNSPVLSSYAPAQLEALDPEIRWRVHVVAGWSQGPLQISSLNEREVPKKPHVRRRT
jgi:hypothetical protein